MAKSYKLYKKTHNITGLQYLGYTIRDPNQYGGSGLYWKEHLRVHGNNVTTEILGEYNNKDELIAAGLYYSKLWNIVESDQWANLKEESGDGGDGPWMHGDNNPMRDHTIKLKQTQSHKEHHANDPVMRERLQARWIEIYANNPELREKRRIGRLGKKHTDETKEKLRQYNLGKKRPWVAEANRKRKQMETINV